jgi:hypothetical protein
MTEALLLDLIEWVACRPRQYAETMEAWRTSCPQLPVWEEAVDRDFVRLQPAGRETLVVVTRSGSDFLRLSGR